LTTIERRCRRRATRSSGIRGVSERAGLEGTIDERSVPLTWQGDGTGWHCGSASCNGDPCAFGRPVAVEWGPWCDHKAGKPNDKGFYLPQIIGYDETREKCTERVVFSRQELLTRLGAPDIASQLKLKPPLQMHTRPGDGHANWLANVVDSSDPPLSPTLSVSYEKTDGRDHLIHVGTTSFQIRSAPGSTEGSENVAICALK
jgi:hypothetical protein